MSTSTRLDIVGNGRMGNAIAHALRAAGLDVRGPFGRGELVADALIVLLCVPDREISTAAELLAPATMVGHVSASTGLEVLAPHERFSIHPLLSVVGRGTSFAGVTCAVDASSHRALQTASHLAQTLGMLPRVIAPDQRALYHAAASAASNFVTTVLGAAEELGLRVGLERDALLPLVQATVNNWVQLGAAASLTGPIVRGDGETVARQRVAIEHASPDLLPLWDALVGATAQLAMSKS